MTALCLEMIKQLNSSVFVLIAILICAFILTYKVADKLARWTEKFQHHDEKITKIENLTEKFIELKTKVELIYDNTNPRKTVAVTSPISLTPLGNEIADKIKANTILERCISQLLTVQQ